MSAATIDVIHGFAEATPEERNFLDTHLAQEREWYKDAPRFMTDGDIEAAFLLGDLVEVKNTDDIQLIGRFHGEGRAENKPYLTPRAAQMLETFTNLWRVKLWEDYHLQTGETRLSVTSMVRSQARQDALVADARKLASPDSTHCTGNAVDIDVSGYYSVWNGGFIEVHSHPGRQKSDITEVSKGLAARYGDTGSRKQAEVYDYRITEAAIEVAQQMHEAGDINLVHEFAGTPNACLHMAVNPDSNFI